MSRVMQNRVSSSFLANLSRAVRSPRFSIVLSTWRQRRRSRTQLNTLDVHILKDIGLTPAQARKEAQRPFWQG